MIGVGSARAECLDATSDLEISSVGFSSRTQVPTNSFSGWGEVMFGSFSKKKALCQCGVIADVDSAAVRVKLRLGKEIECMACRNERIAKELLELQVHFFGQEDEEGRS